MQVVSTATEHAESNTATDCATFSKDPETLWFKSLPAYLLSSELLLEHEEVEKYKIRRDRETCNIRVTTAQRSWIKVMLRMNLGDVRVAHFIFNHNILALFDFHLPENHQHNN